MVSNINSTLPQDGVAAAKADLRANLAAAKAEIETLQAQVAAAVQRANHTGTQLMATIADAGTLATKSTVLTADITDGNVSRTKIQNDAVDLTKLYHGTANRVLGFDGSGVPAELIAGTNVTINGGVISATGGGGNAAAMGFSDVKAFSAAGDGTTDDTAEVQAAIDATANGGVVYFPPGIYSVNQLSVPHAKAMTFLGASPRASILKNRTAGQDIFRLQDPAGATTQDRFVKRHIYKSLGFEMNTGAGDLSTPMDRCTVAGLPIGPCAIAYVSTFVPTAVTDPGINAAWLNSFGKIEDCICNVTAKNSTHSVGFVHHSANHYGWRYKDILLEGVHYGITNCLPFARRVTAATNNFLTVVNTANPYQNGARLFVTAHSAFGTMPGGLSKNTTYFVVQRTSTTFKLSLTSGGAEVDVTSTGSGSIYVHGAGLFAGEFAPDGVTITDLTHFAGRCHISLANCENLMIGRVDGYAAIAPLHLHGRQSTTRATHLGARVLAFYSESPQDAVNPVGEDCVHINSIGGRVDYLQVRGEAGNLNDPIVRLAGQGYQVNLDLISSLSQAQPTVILDGNNIGLTGVVHTSCTLQNNGTNNWYNVATSGGTGWEFQSASPFV